ncbi:MAG: aldolase/citrate lyase family protein [Kofleriaceae bacterium]
MNGAIMRASMRAGKPLYGTMLTALHPTRHLAMLHQLRLDFAVIDTEHAPLGRAEAAEMAARIALFGCVPIIRTADRTALSACQALDAGAHGVIVPYCESRQQVELLVRSVRHHPVKGARLDAHARIPKKTAAALAQAHRNTVIIIGIESEAALDALDDISSVEGIDGIFVGTQDLSYSLGFPNELDATVVVQAFTAILETCARRGLPAAIWPLSLSRAAAWSSRGMSLLLHSSDYRAAYEGLRNDFAVLRESAEAPTKRSRRR